MAGTRLDSSRRRVVFIGGDTGPWRVSRLTAVTGDGLPNAARVAVVETVVTEPVVTEPFAASPNSVWELRGVTSYERYVHAAERAELAAVQPSLGRPEATRAALIPITKSEAWWALPQDTRRAILEERSHHIAIGLRYLPAVARRLHHSRDLGEPFDFLAWLEYTPVAAAAFEDLIGVLRATEEWRYVEREIDIRLERDAEQPAP